MRVAETKVYQFDELSDTAKEKARAWFRDGNLDYEWHDCVIEDAKAIAALMHIDISKVYFSGFYSQGDGACFEGSYNYNSNYTAYKPCLQAVIDYAPQDSVLHGIAAALDKMQETYKGAVYAHIKQSGRYYHENATEIDVELDESLIEDTLTIAEIEDAESTTKTLLRRFMQWIYSQLEKEYDYLNSDESVDENIKANEYEFTEDGSIF